MADQWYAINSHSNKEDVLFNHMQSMGYEVFYPRIKVNPVNPRAKKIRPYFPGYMFVHSDIEKVGTSVFQWMPYAKGVVAFGGEPSIVPDALIYTLRQRVKDILIADADFLDTLVPGDRVVIDRGPFEGYEALFDTRIAGKERVRVLLQMLNRRNLPVEINADSIRKKT